jgi:predicted AAA+ superfamily ATPase
MGSLGESAVYHELLKNGYTVYFTMSDGAKFDFVAYKEDKGLQSVEVKTTGRRNKNDTGWIVKIRRSRYKQEHDFDNSEIDILAVYIEPIEQILFFNAKDITQKTSFEISDSYVTSILMEGKSVRRLTPS